MACRDTERLLNARTINFAGLHQVRFFQSSIVRSAGIIPLRFARPAFFGLSPRRSQWSSVRDVMIRSGRELCNHFVLVEL